MQYTVFLSHSSRDQNLVTNVRNKLENAGINVYVAEEDFQLGKSLSEKILTNIKSANCMVVILTDTGIRSQFVNQEIGIAEVSGIPIIPMVDARVRSKVKGLLAEREQIVFDRRKPEQAIQRVSSYISSLKLKIQGKMEEDFWNSLVVIAFVVLFAILMYFALRKR